MVSTLVGLYREKEWWDLFWSLLCEIWLKRNAWVFEGRKVEVVDVIMLAGLAWGVCWCKCQSKLLSGVTSSSLKVLKAPNEGFVNVTSDVAVFEDGKVGLRRVMRDEEGEVMVTTYCCLEGEMGVNEAGAIAARHAVKIATEAGLRSIVLESYCQKLITHLKLGLVENTSFGNIVANIVEFGSCCSSF